MLEGDLDIIELFKRSFCHWKEGSKGSGAHYSESLFGWVNVLRWSDPDPGPIKVGAVPRFGQRLHALYESFVAQIDLLSQGVLPQRYFGGGSDQVRITTRTPKPVGGDQNRLP